MLNSNKIINGDSGWPILQMDFNYFIRQYQNKHANNNYCNGFKYK